jgi:PadR family transcriptional regulator, regulatory protein AphA
VGTSPKFAVLGFLYIRPMHGYDLHKHLQADLCEVWRVSQSQAYNILRMLEKDNWITATPQPQEKRPDRALLSLTQLGQAEFERWLYAPSPGNAQAIRIAFISRLYFASQIDANLCSNLIQEQARSVESDLDALCRRQAALPADQIYNHLGLELRIRQLYTILNWLETCHSCFEEDKI